MQKLKSRLTDEGKLDELDTFLARYAPELFLKIGGEYYILNEGAEITKRQEMLDEGLYIKGDELFKNNPDGVDFKVDSPEENPLSEEIRKARKD